MDVVSDNVLHGRAAALGIRKRSAGKEWGWVVHTIKVLYYGYGEN